MQQVNPQIVWYDDIRESIFDMTVELSRRGLSTKGLKAELQERLRAARRQEQGLSKSQDERCTYDRLVTRL